ncbi:hypothetical protein GCM10027403_27480 [Arthrobacter tecti]
MIGSFMLIKPDRLRNSSFIRQFRQYTAGVNRSEKSASVIGERMRAARKQARITQEDLADLSGVSERTIRAIETGTGNPSLAAVIAAAKVLGLRLEVS